MNLARLMLRHMGLLTRFAGDRMSARATAALPEADRQLMVRLEFQAGFLKIITETLRQGPRGAQSDVCLIVSPWDFRPEDIEMPVQLWYGDADRNTPPAMATYLAGAIPNSRIQFYPGEGHLSLFAKNAPEFLSFLAD